MPHLINSKHHCKVDLLPQPVASSPLFADTRAPAAFISGSVCVQSIEVNRSKKAALWKMDFGFYLLWRV